MEYSNASRWHNKQPQPKEKKMATTETIDRGDAHVATSGSSADDLTAIIASTQTEIDPDDPAIIEAEAAADAKAADAKAADEAAKAKPKAEDAPRDDKGKFVPKARFDEATAKERGRAEAAERQLAELQGQLSQVSRNADITQLDAQIMELRKADRRAIMTGNEEESVRIGTEIDRLNRQVVIQQASDMSAYDKESAREQIRVETAIEKLELAFPQLAEGGEEYDEQLTNFVLAEQKRLIAEERMPPAKALVKAANDVMGRFVEAAPEAGKGLSAAAKGADRKALSVAKNIDAAKRQPADLKEVGIDSDKAGIKGGVVDASKLSYEEFAALPAATKSRMRGDLS
jgi:hypothetical protein